MSTKATRTSWRWLVDMFTTSGFIAGHWTDEDAAIWRARADADIGAAACLVLSEHFDRSKNDPALRARMQVRHELAQHARDGRVGVIIAGYDCDHYPYDQVLEIDATRAAYDAMLDDLADSVDGAPPSIEIVTPQEAARQAGEGWRAQGAAAVEGY